MAKGFQDNRYRQLIERLVARRKQMQLSQEALAQRLGTHQQFVSRFEIGERRLDVVEFYDVTEALDMNVADLLGSIPSR